VIPDRSAAPSSASSRRYTAARALRITLSLAAAACAAGALATTMGSSHVGLRDLPAVLAGQGDSEARVIFADVRLPRVLLAAIVGAALASAGGALQSVLRNPLADPYILGLSGGAGLGAILWSTIAPASSDLGPALRPLFAFAGAVTAVFGLLALSRARGRKNAATMLLMGAVLNATCIALILFVVTVADVGRYQGVMYWLVGSLSPPSGGLLAAIYVCVTTGVIGLTLLGPHLNLLSAGEETAAQLGSPVTRVRLLAILAACLVTAAAVSVSGLIGFVGLMVPHLARLWFGPDNRLLVPASALLGALILIVADTLARVLLAPTQIPVGVITAIAGGPCFLWLFAVRGDEAGAS